MSERPDVYQHEMRFEQEGRGLKPRFQHPYQRGGQQEGYRALITCDVEVTPDHGILTFPVRLPRYLMPGWSQDDWTQFLESQLGFFHNFTDEAVVQCLSLALCSQNERRKEILSTVDGVVIDFRGDLPNLYLPMMLGGYKIGIYRSGNNWPLWIGIQPTYDLALKEAQRVCVEAGLPKKSVTVAGALANFQSSSLDIQPILSNAPATINYRSILWVTLAILIALTGWFIR